MSPEGGLSPATPTTPVVDSDPGEGVFLRCGEQTLWGVEGGPLAEKALSVRTQTDQASTTWTGSGVGGGSTLLCMGVRNHMCG